MSIIKWDGTLAAGIGGVMVNRPALVGPQRVHNRACGVAAVDGDVVLVAVFANIAHQPLEPGDFHHAVAAEALWPVGGDFPLANVSAHFAVQVVR